jgi:beta-lactamase regulating signal transducer with metallopeptidase domain
MSDTLEALGWTLIHFCWQATAVAVLYLAADSRLRKASSQTRYLLTLTTLSLMFLAFAVTLGYETLRSSATALLQPGQSPALTLAPSLIRSFTAQAELLAHQPNGLPVTSLLPWLDGAWVLGVLSLSIRSLGGWWWLERLRRTTMDEAPEAVQATFRKVCAKLGIARLPELRISVSIPGPMTIGVLRTLVLLPVSALLALSPDQLEAVFAHELAHVRRADYFWNLMQTLAESLFFFHPAVWWVGKRLREQRELCCDDVAVKTCSDPLIYATALLRLEDQRTAGLSLAMALDGHLSPSTFRARIMRILGETPPQPLSQGLRPLSLLAVCASLFLFLSPVPKALGGMALQHSPEIARVLMPHLNTTNLPQAHPGLNSPSLGSPSLSRVAEAEASDVNTPSPHISNAQGGHANEPPSHIASARGTYTDEPSPHISNLRGADADVPPPHLGTESSVDIQSSPQYTFDQKLAYINQMRAVGYDHDESQYPVMEDAGITPAYAKEMANLGFGRPSVGDLLQMKKQEITAQYLTTMRAAGLEPRSIDELVSYRLFNITPEFIAGMKAAGYGVVPAPTLQNLRALGITPEYARFVKQQFPNATLPELMQLGALHIDDSFIVLAKSHGFENPTIQQLIKLRTSGELASG